MIQYDLKKLQNGSDIRGISLTGIKNQAPNLTDIEATLIGKGFLLWLCKKTGKNPEDITIAVGRDPRLSGQMLLSGLLEAFGPYGVKVLDCGLASTPAMFMATIFDEVKADGSIMITASHLPYNRNGFKFFTKDGGLNKEDISEILKNGEEKCSDLGSPTHESSQIKILGKKTYPSSPCNLMTLYCDFLKNIIIKGVCKGEKPLLGLKIAVDAGNGSGGFYAKNVLEPLGADISSSVFLEPDGTFPNHPPNPENKEALSSFSLHVLSTGADFGIIFDTDVDRSAAIDSRGREIAKNGIVAMAASLVSEEHPQTTIVTDSITSNHLTYFIEKTLNMKHLRYVRGYKNVINKALELNNQGEECWLAIETSGHAALKENYFLDDGAYLATKIVIKGAKLFFEGKKLDSIIENLKMPKESKELRFEILCDDFSSYGDNILTDFKNWIKKQSDMKLIEPNYEGVRAEFENGWFLLRKSLHDPVLPFNIESDIIGECDKIIECVTAFLKSYECINID